MAMRWYVVHVFSGSENKVKQLIEEQAVSYGLEDQIGEIMVPSEEVTEIRRGARVPTERKFFPGYILINMELTDQSWQIVQSQNRVTGFLGHNGNKPIPITEEEAERLIKQVREGVDRPSSDIIFEVGEEVKVSDGPFASFNGYIEEVDEDRSRLKVTVSIFGRSTPVDLEYSQVKKI